MPETEIKVPRDIRVEQLGFVNELYDQFFKPLNDEVKKSMIAKGQELVRADFFEGKIVQATPTFVDNDLLLRLYDAGKLTRKELLTLIGAKVEPCRKFFSAKDLAKISVKGTLTNKLCVERIDGVEVALVDAVRALAKELIGAGA
jgi:hypothetical protein